ncbi:MAG: VWA domain-containing protein [Rhodospirillales bacterium]|nr:VWA domain-containing protein [Rhodospirillales bacterium]
MSVSAAAILKGVRGEAIVLEEVSAEASINDLMAEVTVTQRYRNPEATNIEAVYTFPLPLDGVLLGFEVEIGDRKLAGVVVEKAEGERRYEEAITDGDAAVLLEQAEPGLYTASVGNLLPGEAATIRFRYGLLLRWNGDRIRFAMPTTIAPRYGNPASAGLLPHQAPEYAFDAERAFSLRMAVRGLLKDARFNSPSHSVSVAPEAEATIIALTGAPAMDRDFVLEACLSRSEAASALVARDLDGWVALASFRPEVPVASHDERRSVKIVVDCSGSMGGDSIAQARDALERILDGLRASDLFEIISFGSSHRALFGRETPVSETTLAQARRFVRALDADMGGTEIGAALDAAYGARDEADLPCDLLLITDGAAWNSDEVIARAKRSGHRIFTVGVGSAVAEHLVRGLAEATGGACEFVAPREDMAIRVHRHFQRMYAPRAKSAGIRWPAAPLRSMPNPLQTVYGGDTLHVFSWFAEKPAGTVTLDVTLADGRTVSHETEVLSFDEGPTVPGSEGASPSTLARLAAAQRVFGMNDPNEATELAVSYQLMSQWTNYVVVHVRAEGEKADHLPEIHKVPQVVAAGWHGMGTVHAARRSVHAEALCYDLDPSSLPAAEECYSLRSEAPTFRGRSAAGIIDPTGLVALLNAWAMRPFPTLDDFEAWGLPDAIVVALEDLVACGEDERLVVLGFLHVLAQSEAGKALERHVRRKILKAYKTDKPRQTVVDAVTCVFDGWQNRNAMEGGGP